MFAGPMRSFCMQVSVLACFLQACRAVRSTLLHGQVSVDEPLCQAGKGGAWWTRIKVLPPAIDIKGCIAQCEREPKCFGIDFAAIHTVDACRLYGPNKPRLGDGGRLERQYCTVRHQQPASSTGWMDSLDAVFSQWDATTSTTTSLDPHEVEAALPSWINSQGEKELDCGLSEKEHGRMRVFLSSSFFDVNDTLQDDSILVDAFMSFKPEGRALWIGDATKGARPYWVRYTSFPGTRNKMKQKTNISLERSFIDEGLFARKGNTIEGMEEVLDGVGVVYLAGGDHMHLMYKIRTTPFGEVLRRRVLEGSILLVTRSAGTIAVGRDVGFSTELQSIHKLAGNFSGLGLIGDCSLRPHFDHQLAWHDEKGGVSDRFKQFLVEQYKRTNGTGKLVTLKDGEALIVQNGKAVIVSAFRMTGLPRLDSFENPFQ